MAALPAICEEPTCFRISGQSGHHWWRSLIRAHDPLQTFTYSPRDGPKIWRITFATEGETSIAGRHRRLRHARDGAG